MKIHFLGGADDVTGSNSLIETAGRKILVDCGMYQGGQFNEEFNHRPLPYNPKDISAVLITHAHLDHVGRLPLLTKGGFTGFFYATPATMDLAELVMHDALGVMIHDNIKFGRQILYSEQDIAAVMAQFKPLDYYQWQDLFGDKNVKVYLRDAGHIFGSAFIEIVSEGKRIVFSGDVGNVNVPILRDTDNLPDDIDLLVCESTYGDKLHESDQSRRDILEKVVLEAVRLGGVLMIPSFSLERTQELLYELDKLIEQQHRLPVLPIFLDSPLAIGATKIYRKYTQYYDEHAIRLIKSGDDMFDFPGLVLSDTREDSKHINNVPNPKIIIAGAGMMNGGRILYHALRYLSDPHSTLLIVGYQAYGTIGREIQEGAAHVNIMGERISVKCKVKSIGAFSAHGDQAKLLSWIGSAKNLPKKVCLNHGETEVKHRLAAKIKEKLNISALPVTGGMEVEV